MYNKKVWNTGERITADKLNNIEEGVYSNALVNKTQQVYINGLFNENKDGRLSVEGEGNSLKLEGSKSGLVEIDKVVGNTLVNRIKEPVSIESVNDGAELHYRFDGILLGTYTLVNLSSREVYYEVRSKSDNSFIRNILVKEKSKILSEISDTEKLVKVKGLASKGWIATDETHKLEIQEQFVLEGDYTNKPIPSEAFEGLQSSFESNLVTQEMVTQGLESEENLGKYKVPVKLTGKNLWCFENKSFIPTKGSWHDIAGTDSMFGDMTNKTDYKVFLDDGYYIFHYGETSNVSNVQILKSDETVMLSSDRGVKVSRGYYLFRVNISSIGVKTYIKDLYIEKVDEENILFSNYEPYFERTTNVYLNSPLLEGDEIVMYNGELCHYRKCKEEILDGNDGRKWLLGNSGTTTSNRFFTDNFNDNFASDIICDKLCTMNGWAIEYAKCIRLSSTALNIYIPSTECGATVDEFKTWLQTNQLRVVYELPEPYYEPIQADKLLLECANDSTLHIDTVVPVESVKASYTGNIPSVYALEETNNNQDSLIDISLCATDEMYLMIEPLLNAVPQTLNNERMISKMVDMYVAMVIRGLKTIDEVPVRYREQVKEILAQLEK